MDTDLAAGLRQSQIAVCDSISAFAGHAATVEQCLQRLALGGIKLAIVLQASTAEQAVKQQTLLARYHLPENTISVTAQPRTLAVCLRQANSTMLQVNGLFGCCLTQTKPLLFAGRLQPSGMWKLQLLRLLQQIQQMLLLPAAVQAFSICRCHILKLRYSKNAL